MQQNAHSWVQKGAAILALLAVSAGSEAVAQAKVKGQYATTRLPISAVGTLNAELSRLCRQGMFKQRKLLRLSIGYVGPNGKGITGIAQRGWNLYDPLDKSEPQRTYHFYNQGYSNCRVYVAVTPPPRRNQ